MLTYYTDPQGMLRAKLRSSGLELCPITVLFSLFLVVYRYHIPVSTKQPTAASVGDGHVNYPAIGITPV